MPEDRPHGGCYPMAAALHRALDWPIQTLVALRDDHASRPHPAHSWVLAPDGRAFDARGFQTIEEMHERLLEGRGEVCRESAGIETHDSVAAYLDRLMDLSGGTDDFVAQYRGGFEEMIAEARLYIDSHLVPLHAPREVEDGISP